MRPELPIKLITNDTMRNSRNVWKQFAKQGPSLSTYLGSVQEQSVNDSYFLS